MHVTYEGLWGVLASRGMTKTELCELTGLSSRTMAKLSRGESVTTDTLAKICAVLGCSLADIAKVTDEDPTLYAAFVRAAKEVGTTEFVKEYAVRFGGNDWRVFVTKRTANKYTRIRCDGGSGTVTWEQFPVIPLIGGTGIADAPAGVIARLTPMPPAYTVFVVAGHPGGIIGLDDGFIRSARRPGGTGDVHVMSMAAFKTFAPAEKG